MKRVVWGCPPPRKRGGRQAVNSMPLSGREFPQGEFISPEDIKNKRAPTGLRPVGNNPQKPVYVNTVWGYGYKWGT